VAAQVASPVRPAPAAEPTEAPAAEPDGEKKKRGPLSFVKELPVLLLVAFLLALLIKSFLVQAFYIPSESMVPTLQIGDRVLVNKVVYHLRDIKRGDIVVFTPVIRQGACTNPVEDPQDPPPTPYIKRVIGEPGDTVSLQTTPEHLHWFDPVTQQRV